MVEELKMTLIALIIGGGLNISEYVIRHFLARRARKAQEAKMKSESLHEEAESRHDDAEARSIDAETIQGLLRTLRSQGADISELQVGQKKLVIENQRLSRENTELAEQNKKLEISLELLEGKNETLSDLVISEQREKVRFRRGVEKLIGQMKDAGITKPAFSLD